MFGPAEIASVVPDTRALPRARGFNVPLLRLNFEFDFPAEPKSHTWYVVEKVPSYLRPLFLFREGTRLDVNSRTRRFRFNSRGKFTWESIMAKSFYCLPSILPVSDWSRMMRWYLLTGKKGGYLDRGALTNARRTNGSQLRVLSSQITTYPGIVYSARYMIQELKYFVRYYIPHPSPTNPTPPVLRPRRTPPRPRSGTLACTQPRRSRSPP